MSLHPLRIILERLSNWVRKICMGVKMGTGVARELEKTI